LLQKFIHADGATKIKTRSSGGLGGRGGQVKMRLSDAARVA
jgi:hypothetical protein